MIFPLYQLNSKNKDFDSVQEAVIATHSIQYMCKHLDVCIIQSLTLQKLGPVNLIARKKVWFGPKTSLLQNIVLL